MGNNAKDKTIWVRIGGDLHAKLLQRLEDEQTRTGYPITLSVFIRRALEGELQEQCQSTVTPK